MLTILFGRQANKKTPQSIKTISWSFSTNQYYFTNGPFQ